MVSDGNESRLDLREAVVRKKKEQIDLEQALKAMARQEADCKDQPVIRVTKETAT